MRNDFLYSAPRVRSAKVLSVLVLVLLGLSTASARACNVPVFRYALEQWQSDPYQVVFFHRGELSPEEQLLLEHLSPEGKAGEIFANVDVIPIDVDTLNPSDPQSKADLELWEQQDTDTLPWLVLRYPAPLRIPKTIWAGEASEESIDRLLDSPKRREIARRILKGDTAVWVLLESGNAEEDEAAYNTLKTQLQICEKSLELPPPDPQDVADGLISVDQAELKIKFSLIRVSRDDPQEAPFVNILLDSEPDLRDEMFADLPMAFPVFGRGRALYALVGKGIVKEQIFDACQELVGPCTCQVKDQNPGVDLLMAVDWERLVTSQLPVDESLPPLPVFSSDGDSSEKSSSQGEGEKEESSSAGGDTIAAATQTDQKAPKAGGSRVMIITLVSLLAAVAGIGLFSFLFVKS